MDDSLPVGKQELGDRLRNISVRLGRHMDSLTSNLPAAHEDVAAVLRILLGRGSRGDNAIVRYCAAVAAPLPTVRVSLAPDTGPETVFGVGSVPEFTSNAQSSRIRILTFNEFADAPVIVSSNASRRITRWHQLASDYGNTYGNHLGIAVPRVLSEIQMLGARDTHLGSHLIWLAGAAVELCLAQVLDGLPRDGTIRTPRTEFEELPLVLGLRLWGSRSGRTNSEASFSVPATVEKTHEVLRMTVDNRSVTYELRPRRQVVAVERPTVWPPADPQDPWGSRTQGSSFRKPTGA